MSWMSREKVCYWGRLEIAKQRSKPCQIMIEVTANGNLRVLHRIFAEIKRLQKLNCLAMVTPELVEVARKGLLLGTF